MSTKARDVKDFDALRELGAGSLRERLVRDASEEAGGGSVMEGLM